MCSIAVLGTDLQENVRLPGLLNFETPFADVPNGLGAISKVCACFFVAAAVRSPPQQRPIGEKWHTDCVWAPGRLCECTIFPWVVLPFRGVVC